MKLIRGCELLGVPTIATEQYPEGLGPTVSAVRDALGDRTPVETKLKFSAWIEAVRRRLGEMARPTVLLCGIEAHVCVLQTALDLADNGYLVAMAWDAVGSRRAADGDLARARLDGVATPLSVEMALLEMVHEAGTDRFKAILSLIR